MRAAPCLSTWSCSGWGLPCRLCCQSRGALLPHHFTLTGCIARRRRYIFCCTGRRLTPPRHYLAPCPTEPGLSSMRINTHSGCLANSPPTSVRRRAPRDKRRRNRQSARSASAARYNALRSCPVQRAATWAALDGPKASDSSRSNLSVSIGGGGACRAPPSTMTNSPFC